MNETFFVSVRGNEQMKRATLLLVLATLGCSLSECFETHEEGIFRNEGICTINAQTLLQSLEEGKTDLFTPLEMTMETPLPTNVPVQWSQADYYRVTQAFHEFAWDEPLENWNLLNLSFGLNCKDADMGPQSLRLTLFKTVQIRDVDSRLERRIRIRPQQGQISWYEMEYYPERLSPGSSLDLTRIKIPAEEALRIAESNGGKEARLAAENNCEIDIVTVAGRRGEDWLVTYSPEVRGATLFRIRIDERTGEYRMTHPQ